MRENFCYSIFMERVRSTGRDECMLDKIRDERTDKVGWRYGAKLKR